MILLILSGVALLVFGVFFAWYWSTEPDPPNPLTKHRREGSDEE